MSNAPLSFDSASPWDETRLRRIVKLGGIAVSVYIRGTPGGFRHASPADVKLARSLGLGVLPNWESTADYFRTASRADAKAAGVEALAACRALGIPDDGTVSVPFSFDYEMPADGFKRGGELLAAAQDGLGDAYRATAYGQSGFIKYLSGHGFGDRGHWLMASTWGLPYDIAQPGVAMVQSHHADGSWFTSPVAATDVDTVTRPGLLGAWWPDGSTHGDDMPTAADVVAELLKPKNVAKLAAGIAQHQIDGDKNTLADYVRHTRNAVDASAKVLSEPGSGILDRVAKTQAAVAKLGTATPATVDVDAVAAAVEARVRAINWGAK